MCLSGRLAVEDYDGHLLSSPFVVAYSLAAYLLFQFFSSGDHKTELSEPVLETAVGKAAKRLLGFSFVAAHIALDCQFTLGEAEYTRLINPIFYLALPTLLLCVPLMLLQWVLSIPVAMVSVLLGCGIPWLMATIATVLSVATNGLLAYRSIVYGDL